MGMEMAYIKATEELGVIPGIDNQSDVEGERVGRWRFSASRFPSLGDGLSRQERKYRRGYKLWGGVGWINLVLVSSAL